MTNLEKDRKIFEEIAAETRSLNEFLDKYSLEEIKANPILQKAITFRLLRVARVYKKLGGRYAQRFGEWNESLKRYAARIEENAASFNPYSLIEEAKEKLPALLIRIEKIKESL